MKKRKKIQIFRLEDRVLFEGAAAAEAVATVNSAGSPSHADKPAPGQEAKDNVQKDAVHDVVQAAGPVSDSSAQNSSSNSAPSAPVQDHGAGLPSADQAAADPTAALVDGTAHLDKVTDPGESFSTDLSDFMHSDLSSAASTTSSALFSSSLSADADSANTDSLSHSEAKELVVIEADAVDNVDPHTLEGKEVLVLNKDADTSAQIDAYLEAHSDVKYDAIKIVSNKAETALTSDSLTTDAVTEIQSHLTDHGSLGFVDVADFNAEPANIHHDFSHGADSHSTDDMVVFPDHDTQVTVDASTELTTGVSDTTDTTVPESLLENADTESHELVIVNSNMADLDNVLSQLGDSRDVLIIDVNSSESATQQIQDYLDAHSDTTYDSVHILTHGSSDGFTLGNTVVDDASDMAVFNGHLTQDGDIMIYGCNLASTEAGQHLINDIADVTGADVAASTDMTGAAAVGGNWTLEYASGTIETTSISLNSSWSHRLQTYDVNGISDHANYKYSSLNDLISSGMLLEDGNDVINITITDSSLSSVTFDANTVIAGSGTLTTDITVTAGDTVTLSITTLNGDMSGAGNLTINGTNLTGNITVTGDIAVTNGTVTGTISGFDSLNVSGGIFGGTITNNHTANISGGTFMNTVTNNGTMDISNTVLFSINDATSPVAIQNNGNLTIDPSADVSIQFTAASITGDAIGINNSDTFTLANGSLSLAVTNPASVTGTIYGVYNTTTGTVDLNGGTINNTNVAPDYYGYGVYNANTNAGLNVNNTTKISGFYFGVGSADDASSLKYSDFTGTGLVDLSDNTYSILTTVKVVAGGAVADDFEFNTIDDALTFIENNTDIAAKIMFSLDSAYYPQWTTAATISSDHILTSNLISITGTRFVYDASGHYYSDTLTQVNLASNKVLTVETYSTVSTAAKPGEEPNAFLFNNIVLNVASGATLSILVHETAPSVIDSYGWIKFSGDGVEWSYENYVNNTWSDVTSQYISPGIANSGIVTITGIVEHDTTAPASAQVVETIRNVATGAELTVSGGIYMLNGASVSLGIVSADDGAFGHQVNVIHNTIGKVTVDSGAQITLTGTGTGSAVIRNEKGQTLNIGDAAGVDGTRITLTGGANSEYAVYNNGTANIYNSFIVATGSGSVGLFNSTEGKALFSVTVTPDAYLTAAQIDALSPISSANVTAYGRLIYSITGGGYSVYNLNDLKVNPGTGIGATITGYNADSSIYFYQAPTIALNGIVYTKAKASTTIGNQTITTLDRVTVNGSIVNSGTAIVEVNEVFLNGNIRNTGSNVYVTGNFRSSKFYLTTSNGVKYAEYSNGITTNNFSQLGAAGNVYFGTDYNNAFTDSVTFNPNQSYSFVNEAGTMQVYYFTGLSSLDFPVRIFNSGVFRMDSNPDTETTYDLYVWSNGLTSLSSADLRFMAASGISDAGIVNYDPNDYSPTYAIVNSMVLTDLNIRNTQDASAGITNYAGNLSVTRGSIQGTYSGIDALVKTYADYSTANLGKYYVEKPTTVLTDVEKIGGKAFSIRNSGDLTLTGANVSGGTLLTNELDIASSYSGVYTAMSNNTVTVYLNEYYESTKDYWNQFYTYLYSGVQEYNGYAVSWGNKQSPNSLTPSMIEIAWYSSSDLNVKTNFDVTTADASFSRGTSPSMTDWHYGNYAVTATADLSDIAFKASASTSATTAILNWGSLTIKGINNDPAYRFTGFTVSIDNGFTDFWATDYADSNPNPNHTPAWSGVGTIYSHFTPAGDYSIGFDLQTSTVKTSSAYRSEMTLRGVESSTGGIYEGGLVVSGGRYVVYTPQTLTLVNFSVSATSSDAIYNSGSLNIFNGVEQPDGSWKGPSNASISATDNTAITNNGFMVMMNGAVLYSETGVNQLLNGAMMIINSTFYNNKYYAIISSATTPSSESSMNFVVIDTTIVGSGNGILLNSGRLDIANTIILGLGGLNLNIKTGATVNYHGAQDSNIIGDGVKNTQDNLQAVFGRQDTPPLDPDQKIVKLTDNSTALKNGVRFSYIKTTAGGYTLYINQTPPSGSIEVTWDKSGNDRESASGDIAIGSYTEAGSPIVAIKVMTLDDEDNGDTTYSLREVINWLQSSSNTSKDTAVTFSWTDLIKEQPDPSKWVFNLDASLGSLVLNAANAAGITIITTNGQYTDASGNTYNVTVNGDGLSTSVFTVDGMTLMLTNIAVDGSGTSSTAVAADGAAVNLSNNAQLILNGGVTITGGNTTGLGGAVYIGVGSTLTLQNTGNAFTGNTAGSGGALYNLGTSNVISTAVVTLSGNTAVQNGGAIYNGGTFAFDATGTGNLSFSGNSAANGGAVYNTGTFTANTASTLSFSGNSATNGGAVYNTGAFTVSATTATFTGNTADNGAGVGSGGAIYNESGTLTVSGTFSGNSAVNGGAIDMAGGTGVISNAYFVSNSATDGGAVYVEAGSIRLEQSALMFNRASSPTIGGTAVYVAGGRFDAVNTTFAKNGISQSDPTDTDSGYAIYAADAAQLYLADVTVADNSSGILLDGTAGMKILVNSIVLNTSGTNLPNPFSNFGLNSYATNSVGDARSLIFGTNELIIDPTSPYYGTISLNDSTSNPAITKGALIALEGGAYYYSTDGGTTWKSAATDAVTTLSSAAVVFNTDQVGSSRTLGSNYSMGAVAIPTDAVYVVNTSDDTIADDGLTSLREAIIAANNFALLYPTKNITIVFDVAHITSDKLVNGTVTLTSSLPDMHCNVTINGWNETYNPSHTTVTVTASSATLTASPLTITAGNVTISNITFVGGNLQAVGSSGTGGMFSITGGTTTFNNVIIGGGTAAMGGAVYIAAGVTVVFNNSTVGVDKNGNGGANTALYSVTTTVDTTVTTHYYMGKGGGIYNAGTLVLNSSMISNNTTGGTTADVYDQVGQGGGIYNAGTLTVNASTLTGNTAGKDGDTATGQGGAIYNARNLVVNAATVIVTYDISGNPIYTIDDSTVTTITDNTSYQSGGAIYNAGTAFVYLEGNNISDNSAVNGGALYNAGTMTVTANAETVSVTDNANGAVRPTNKLLASNSASNQGGAIYNANGSLTLTYSTLTGNSAATDGSAVYFAGGTGTIINATFAGNTGSGATISVAGGSVNIFYATVALNKTTGINISGGTVSLRNSLLASNGADGASDISGKYTDRLGNVISNGLYSTTLLFETGTLDASDGTLHLRSTLLNPAAVNGVYNESIDGKNPVDQNGQKRYYEGNEASVGAWAFTTKPTTGYRFVVTTGDDVVNDGDGLISLREAITYVNQKGGFVYFDYAEIIKNSGNLTLSVDATLGSFAITGDMTIDGNSYSSTLGIDFRADHHDARLKIDGSALTAASVFTITNAAVTFTTLDMVGGTTSGNGGVFNITGLTSGKTITLTDLNVYGGKATTSGGALYQDSGNLVIQGSNFYGATAGVSGGSIYFTGNTLTIMANTDVILSATNPDPLGQFTVLRANYVNSTFNNNTATTGSGGAIYFAGTNLSISAGNIVTETSTVYIGTGIYDSSKTWVSTTITDISAGYVLMGLNKSGASGGAIYVGSNAAGTMSTVSLSNVYMIQNEATGSGGGIYMTNGNLTLSASWLYSNISGSTGGGIYFDGDGSLDILGSGIEFNTATGSGGGIYFAGNTLSIKGNTATYLTDSIIKNGSITVVTVNAVNSAVDNNTSKTGSGGGIYFAGNKLELSGTGTDVTQTTTVYDQNEPAEGVIVTISETSTTLADTSDILISMNTATAGDGGAVYIQENTSDTTLRITLSNAYVYGNQADKGRGGAFFLTPNDTFYFVATNTTVTGNSALNGGAFYFASEISEKATLVLPTLLSYNYAEQNGGAIYAVGNLKWSSAVTFTGNTAKGKGGALYVEGNLEISGTSVFNSNGTTGQDGDGGAIYVGGNLTISGGTFTNNYVTGVFGDGGAIYVVGTVDMSGSVTFTGNEATSGGRGGAVYVGGGASGGASKIDGVTATLNFGADGGVFYFASGTVTIAGRSAVSLNNNTGLNGGAIYIAADTTVTIGTKSFSLNNNMAITGILLNSDGTSDSSVRIGGNGGAIYNNGTLTINRTTTTWLTFAGNQAVGYDKFTDTGLGGFIYNVGTVELSFVNVNNSASSRSGGAIYSYGTSSSVSLTMTTFTGNQTKAYSSFTRAVGSGSTTVDATKAEGNGGAVYMEGGTLTIDSSTFTSNSATNIDDKSMNVDRGGAVYFSGSGALTIKSTVVDTSYSVSVIVTTTFSGNEAARGGALYVDAATGATVSISNVSVANNIGRYTTEDGISSNAGYVSQGVGFWLGGSSSVRITIENTTFSGNTQEYITWGGGLYVKDVGLNLINTTFYNNTANHGGGLYIASANVSMVNSTVGYNTVTDRLHSGLGGGGILVTGASTTLNMLNTVVAGNINTQYTGTSSNYQYNDIVFKVASFDNITMKYNVLGYVWNSIDSTTYSELTATELGSTNTYEQLGSDVFQQQSVGGVEVPVFGRFLEWERYYAASNVIFNPVYATTATLMIRPDGVAAYKGVYSAIDRSTGALYYNTINSSKVTSTTDISGSWVNFADDSSVTITNSNIVTNGQNGWTRTDQLTFNTYNVGAHALKSLDANYYAGPDYEYDVTTTYYVNPTVTKAYTDATQYYYDAFNPFDGAITLREAVFLAGQTLTRSYYSSDPDVQSLTETFVFSTDIRFNTDPNYPGNVFGAMDGGSPTSTYYTPTTNVFTGYEVIQLDSEFYGALTFSKTDDAQYTLAGYGTDGSYLAITLSGGSGLLNMTSGNLSLYGFEALLGGTTTAGGVFNVSGGDLSVSYVKVISGGNAETGGVIYQTGGNVTIGTLDYTIVMSGNDASTSGVIAYQTGGNLLLINTYITQNNIADVASDSLFQLSGGAITLLNSTVYYNYGQSLSILAMSAGSVTIADSTIAFNGVTSDGYTAGMSITGGTLNVLNSIIDFTLPVNISVSQSTVTTTTTDEEGNETTTTSTQSSYTSIYTLNVISSLIGYLNSTIFVMDGDLPLVGNNGTLVISSSGLAATDGVMVGYITGSDGVTTVYYKTSESAKWISISTNTFLDPSYDSLVTVVTNGQNGAVRNYAGYDYLSIGAYSMPARGIPGAYTLVVTISGDIWDAGDNETSLREALYLAGKLYELDGGITWKITFADSTNGYVVVDTSLAIDGFNVVIEGGTGINVSASATYAGDSIFVISDGSRATLNNLTIEGVSDAALLGGAINVTDSTLTLNNTALLGGMVAMGGALYADGSTVTMNGGSIVGGSAALGGGVYAVNSTLKLTGVTVSGNSSTAAGGGIYLAGGSLSATSSVFVDNTAGTSGGAVYSTSGTLSIQNSTFENNTAAVSGGAVYNQGANGTVSGTFTNNDATAGSGGAVYNGTGVLSVSGTFTDNNAGVNGGAIYNATGTVRASGSFTTNTAANGGAIFNADGTLSVSSATFTYNTVSEDGGAIYNENGALGVSGSTFEGNNATNGGAIYTSGTNSSVSGAFDNNFASGDGGAIYTVGALLSASGTFTRNLALGNGGAIYNAGQKLNAAGTFAGNTAVSGNGGAIYNLTQASASGIFQGNIAMTGNGGAVYNAGMVTLSGGFSDNLAEDGAALYNTGSADLLNFNIASNEANTGSIVTSVGANADLYLNNGSFSDNTGVNLVTTDGHAALLTVTTAANNTTSSLVNAASLDLLNSSITGTTGDGSALIRATTALQIANSIVVGNSAADTAVDATGAVKFYTAYSIFSGNAAQLANASVNVENLTGNSFATVFGSAQLNAFGQLVIPDDSPAAMGVWTTYNRATGAIHYSTRPEGIWTVGYNVNNVQWNYLGPGNNMSGFSLSNLVVSNGHPSIGAYWLNSSSSLPDFGPGVNTDLANPSYNGMTMDWGYNSVIDAFLADPQFYLTMSGEFSMDWMESLSRQLFGVPYVEMNTFSVFGGRGDLGAVPSGEYGLGISINGAASDDFTRFEETPYHSDGTPLTENELEFIRNAAVKGAVEEEAIPTLSETIGEKVLSALRSADIFKDSFDKALDQLLGVDA